MLELDLPRALARWVWQISDVSAVEYLDIVFKSLPLDALSSTSQKTIDHMVIMHLEQSPCGHLLCAKELIEVCAMVIPARVAFTPLD
jgi:hypothetical protein